MLAQLLAVPFILKLLLSLFIILGVNRLVKKLSLAVLAGTLVFALWSPRSPVELLAAAHSRAQSPDDFIFLLMLFMAVWLSAQMSAAGTMKRLVSAAESLLPRRSALAAMPMLIGFLPMPGGALFSAPLVAELDPERKIDANLKARINYWFRHIWEYWWPLYPGALLAAEIFKLPPWLFMAIQLPLTLMAVGSGYLFLLRQVPRAGPLASGDRELRREARRAAWDGSLPIIILTVVYALVSFLVPVLSHISKYLPMVCGVAAAMIVGQWRQPLPASKWKSILLAFSAFEIALAVWLVRVYGSLAEMPLADGRLPLHLMRGELAAWGFPVLALVMVLPFIAGVTSGVAIGFVGATFPFAAALLPVGAPLAQRCALEVLAYGFGYMGLILSPIHACLIVSCAHFQTGVGKALVRMLLPCALVLIGTLAWYAVLRNL